MKSLLTMILLSIFLITTTAATADDRKSRYGRTYGDARYELEKKYPSAEHRYSRKELDQARRRANNSEWMQQWGKKDPIYKSDQYRGRSSGYYSQPYRSNRYGHQW
ncbi:MAG: hypothetical protein QNL62_08405 [Gammaproteobacteria bacterium]|nr:hypothetical protein [Gammaproteobacteria bacterium]